MDLTRCGQGMVLLALVLAFFAFLFDDIPAALAAGALVFFLAARSAVFLSVLSSTVVSIAVTRTVSSRYIRRGTAVEVTTWIGHALRPSFSLHLTDLLPDGAALIGGSPADVSDSTLHYTLAPLSIGEHPFGGIRLTLSDPFFTTTLTDRRAESTEPSLTVLPASDYALSGKDLYGESESQTISPIPSPGIRSFREYLPGDDPRKIDWKLSAKHDTLYVREYMGRSDTAQLLIIDLPDASVPFSTKAFTRLKEAAVAAIATQLFPSPGIPVLLISGANLISFSPVESDPEKVITLMRQLSPAPRLHHLYRHASTPSLRRRYSPRNGGTGMNNGREFTGFRERSRESKNPGTAPAEEEFARTLAAVTGSFLSRRTPTTYEAQLARALHPLSTTTAHLFSLAEGDESHLRLLAEQATLRGMAVHLHIPEESYDLPTRAKMGRCSFASVEVV